MIYQYLIMISMKKCKWCKEIKSLTKFSKNKREKDGYRRQCIKCCSQYEKDRYNQKPFVRATHAKGQENRLYRNRMYLFNYLQDKYCIDCGENDPIVLEFDHVRGEKKSSISQLVAQCAAITTIQNEIDKCEIRCANCHRRKTSTQLEWYNKNDPTQSKSYDKIIKLAKIKKGLTFGLRGSKVSNAKLNEEKVKQLKIDITNGDSLIEIANRYDVSVRTIYAIKAGKAWKHV